jgi:hypothetical protein
MSRADPRSHPTGHPRAGPSPSSVRVVEPDDRSRQFAGRSSTKRRKPGGVRLTARIVMTLVFATGGLALFDLYLLVSAM